MTRNRAVLRAVQPFLAALLFLLLPILPAAAHPDIAITVRVLFDMRRGVLTGLGESWTFDAAYSRVLLDQFDRDRDGQFNPEEVTALRDKLIADLSRKRFFTELTMEGKWAARLQPVDFTAESHDNVVTVSFAFSLAGPLDLRGRSLDMEVKDKDYVVAFKFADTAPLQLRSDGGHCRTSRRSAPDHAYFARLVIPERISLTCDP